jgi:hypothetical protein
LRQFISVMNISVKMGGNPFSLMKNTLLTMTPKNKFKKYLMDENVVFWFRDQFGNNPNLAEHVTGEQYYRLKGLMRILVNVLGKPVSWADSQVLVGAFKTYYDLFKKRNKGSITDEKAMEFANDALNEVLLFGVASTDTAFRSNFSNDRSLITQMFSKFQSENILHVSAIIRAYYNFRNRAKGSKQELLREASAFALSGFFSAIVGMAASLLRGYLDEDDDLAFEFFVNEFIWSNLVGALPVINQFLMTFEFSLENKLLIAPGFPVKLTPVSEFGDAMAVLTTIGKGDGNDARKILKFFEHMGQILGFPVKNLARLVDDFTRLFTNQGYFLNTFQFFTSKSDAELLNQAIKDGNQKVISTLVTRTMNSSAVQNELTRLVLSADDAKLNLYSVDSFRKKTEDGTYKKYEIPEKDKEKLKASVKKGLLKLFGQSEYKTLPDDEKLKTIQRVINYYYNAMKADILKEEYTPKSIDEVIQSALRYSE